jgi:membrane peptidoglycan carboxypeptidase
VRRERLIGGILASILLVAMLVEMRTSVLQSEVFARYASGLTYWLGDGESPSIAFPAGGPHNERHGYARLPVHLHRARENGFEITHQARVSEPLFAFTQWAGFSVYSEKSQAGLTIVDLDGMPIYRAGYPRHVYRSFDEIPQLVVDTLLFIENRQLLDPSEPRRNPAVEWRRFGAAAVGQIPAMLRPDDPRLRGGGSTLATQLQKFHHSPEGRTGEPGDKLKQMISASLKAYRDGVETEAARRLLVRDYLNATPLGGRPGFGEILGIADGLAAWFGTDFDEANRLLASPTAAGDAARRAEVYRQLLMLLLAQRRPAYYLGQDGWPSLDELADAHLRLLAARGVIDPGLRDAALRVAVKPAVVPPAFDGGSFIERKAVNRVRTSLLSLLDVPNLYALDRLDLRATTPLHIQAQADVTAILKQIGDQDTVDALGLSGYRLLGRRDPTLVRYSVLVYQSTQRGNLLRVQADNFDQPFDMNDNAMLDLGSTAKLRTLVSYLSAIERLYERYRSAEPGTLARDAVHSRDPLARWVAGHLLAWPYIEAEDVLAAAMERTYSASPNERFFTGGGLHRFRNFDSKEDLETMTVREAFKRSVNLVFVRLLQDVVAHHVANVPGVHGILDDPLHPLRRSYLERFADMEGRAFLSRFYGMHAGSAAGAPPRPVGRHPLEHWVTAYLADRPDASWAEVVEASRDARQEAYAWLFRSRRETAIRNRIRIMLERDAFERVHEEWQRLGYPFQRVVPSYASALGASADRPSSLAELMGIIVNGGVRRPLVRITGLHFAEATPFEAVLERRPEAGERVVSQALTRVVRSALIDTVEEGTGRRLRGAFTLADGTPVPVGGKTGTGDHREKRFAAGGHLVHSTVVNRNATLVFFIGDDLYGTITAHVPGPEAAHFRFTSALAAQLLTVLAPALTPLLDTGEPGV